MNRWFALKSYHRSLKFSQSHQKTKTIQFGDIQSLNSKLVCSTLNIWGTVLRKVSFIPSFLAWSWHAFSCIAHLFYLGLSKILSLLEWVMTYKELTNMGILYILFPFNTTWLNHLQVTIILIGGAKNVTTSLRDLIKNLLDINRDWIYFKKSLDRWYKNIS